jgi:hypothetical protein
MSLPYIGKCVLCGAENEAVNEGICAKHSDETAQAYLFGFADGQATQPASPAVEGLRMAAEATIDLLERLRGLTLPQGHKLGLYAGDFERVMQLNKQALSKPPSDEYKRGLATGHKNNEFRESLWFAHRDRLEAEIDRLQKAALAHPKAEPQGDALRVAVAKCREAIKRAEQGDPEMDWDQAFQEIEDELGAALTAPATESDK